MDVSWTTHSYVGHAVHNGFMTVSSCEARSVGENERQESRDERGGLYTIRKREGTLRRGRGWAVSPEREREKERGRRTTRERNKERGGPKKEMKGRRERERKREKETERDRKREKEREMSPLQRTNNYSRPARHPPATHPHVHKPAATQAVGR